MKRRIFYLNLFFILFAALVFQQFQARYFSRTLKVTFFDVGQGDSVLLEFPSGKNMLVDAGGGSPKNTAGRRLIPELRAKGILNLDAVLLTHPDSDHILGFTDIARAMAIKEYWLNSIFVEPKIVPLLWQVQWLFKANNVIPHYFNKREQLNWQGVEMEVLPSTGEGENNQGLVLKLTYGGCRVLLTGDIEKEGESEITKLLSDSIHLLKVAHHGSGTSSTPVFLRKTQPLWSVISVGWGNRYGHPKDFVAERLRSVESEIFRTDWHGYVEFTINSSGMISCNTARGSCGHSKCL